MKTSDADRYVLKSVFLKKSILCIVLVATLTLLAACSSNDDPAPAAPGTTTPPPVTPSVCKVTTQTASGTGRESATITYTYTYTINYGYDDKGNQTSMNATYKYTYSDGKTANSTSSTSRQFDNNDFLLRSVMQYASTDRDGVASSQSSTSEYTYENDRLSKETTSTTNNGKVKDYNFTYEYDTDGRVTKASTTYDNSYTKFEWSGNKLQKMTRVDMYGNSTSPFLEFNAQGWLTKSIETYGGGSTDEMRYEYNAEGDNIRTERYINAKPSSAWTNEFDTKENPFLLMYKKYKGHPTVPHTQPEYAPKHNLTKSTYYGASATGQWEVASTTIYTNDYNARNFPVDVIVKTLDKNGVQTSSYRTSYQFMDCQ